jgi:Uma2 family endonuclease
VRKRRLHERFAVPECWFVDLDADRVEVYVLRGGHYGPPVVVERDGTLRSVALEGFAAAVDDLLPT